MNNIISEKYKVIVTPRMRIKDIIKDNGVMMLDTEILGVVDTLDEAKELIKNRYRHIDYSTRRNDDFSKYYYYEEKAGSIIYENADIVSILATITEEKFVDF
jgi:hypothetical protein